MSMSSEQPGDRQAEEALRATEMRLQLALAGARAGIWQWDLRTQEVIWSPELYDLLGLERGSVEPSGGKFLEVIHPEDRDWTLAQITEAIERGGHFGFEFRALRVDGTEIWVSTLGRVEHDAEGQPVMAVGINQDITARRQAEQQREEALRTMQLALEIAQAGVWKWDLIANRVTGDESLARVFHLPVAEVVAGRLSAEEFFREIHPEDRAGVEERLREVFAAPGEYELEFRLLHAGGGRRWMVSRGRVEVGADGKVRRLTGLILDITERKQAELNARFLLELDAALAPLSDADEIEQEAVERLGIHLGAEHCYFGQINGKHVTIRHEYRRGEISVLGEYDLDGFLTPEARERMAQGEAIPVEDVRTDPRTAATVDNYTALGIGAFLVAPVKYHDRWVGSINCLNGAPRAWRPDELRLMLDLAARVWPLIEQARAARALREADQRKDEFLAMLAHELRNPLAPIRNAAQVLKLVGPADAHQQWAREVIERQTQHLTRLVDDLLDVSRITQGKVTITREPIDLAMIVHRAVEASRPLIDARHHQLTVALPPEPVRLEGDLTRLVQVLGNLLNNAAKYTDEGGSIHLEASREGAEAVLRVRDNGMGLPPDLLPHIFDLFTQADRSLDRSQGGLGIGLTLVRQLVQLHGGRVEARSEGPGRGSELIVRLPAEAEAAAADAGQSSGEGDRPAVSRLKILLVEDSVDSAEMMSFLLQLRGHEVRIAHDGPAALETARSFVPEVVLCDIGLPGMNGYEVAVHLREQPAFQRTPLIALTGYGQEEARNRSREAGFDYHLVKPVEPDALTALIETLRPAQIS